MPYVRRGSETYHIVPYRRIEAPQESEGPPVSRPTVPDPRAAWSLRPQTPPAGPTGRVAARAYVRMAAPAFVWVAARA